MVEPSSLTVRTWARKSSTNHGSARCAAARPGCSSTATRTCRHLRAGSRLWRTHATRADSSVGIEWTRPNLRPKAEPRWRFVRHQRSGLAELDPSRGTHERRGRGVASTHPGVCQLAQRAEPRSHSRRNRRMGMHWHEKLAEDWGHLVRRARCTSAELAWKLTLLRRGINSHSREWEPQSVAPALVVLAAIAAGILVAQL